MKAWWLPVLGVTLLGACGKAPAHARTGGGTAAVASGAPQARAQTAVPAGAQATMPAASGISSATGGPSASAPAASAHALYVDVRTPAEYAAGHVRGAINIPYDQMPERWSELSTYRDSAIVLYCQSGRRAGIALQVLQQHGFADAVNGGGFGGLVRQGIPVTPN